MQTRQRRDVGQHQLLLAFNKGRNLAVWKDSSLPMDMICMVVGTGRSLYGDFLIILYIESGQFSVHRLVDR